MPHPEPTTLDHAGGVKRSAAEMTTATLTADWMAYAEVCTRYVPDLQPPCTRSAPSGAPSAQAPLTPSALCVCTGLRQQRACLRRRRAGEAHHRPRVAQHAGITRPARRGRGIRRGGAAARLAGCRGTAWRRRGRGACSGAGGLGTARHRHVGSMTCGHFYLLTLWALRSGV